MTSGRSQLPMVLLLPTVLLTVLVMAGGVQCNGECEGLPSIDHIYQILKYSFIYDTLDIIDTQITCLAQGTKKDTYRELSMIVLVKNKIGWICQVQFEMDCSRISQHKNIWTTRPNTLISSIKSCRISSRESVLGSNITIYTILEASNNSTTQGLTITTTQYDCYHCMKTTIIPLEHDHHCYACNSSCYTTGLRRCIGPTSSECCVAFNEEGTCINTTDCTIDNHEANQHNNYTCGCPLSCSHGFNPNPRCTECEPILTCDQLFCDVNSTMEFDSSGESDILQEYTLTNYNTNTPSVVCPTTTVLIESPPPSVVVIATVIPCVILILCMVTLIIVTAITTYYYKLRKSKRNKSAIETMVQIQQEQTTEDNEMMTTEMMTDEDTSGSDTFTSPSSYFGRGNNQLIARENEQCFIYSDLSNTNVQLSEQTPTPTTPGTDEYTKLNVIHQPSIYSHPTTPTRETPTAAPQLTLEKQLMEGMGLYAEIPPKRDMPAKDTPTASSKLTPEKQSTKGVGLYAEIAAIKTETRPAAKGLAVANLSQTDGPIIMVTSPSSIEVPTITVTHPPTTDGSYINTGKPKITDKKGSLSYAEVQPVRKTKGKDVKLQLPICPDDRPLTPCTPSTLKKNADKKGSTSYAEIRPVHKTKGKDVKLQLSICPDDRPLTPCTPKQPLPVDNEPTP